MMSSNNSSSSSVELEECLRSLSLDYLNLLINGQSFSDVTFSVEGRLVHAHRCILAARSLFFRKLFYGNPPDSPDPGEAASPKRSSSASSSGLMIPVNSVGYEVFMLMLQFMYSGQVSIVPERHQPRPDCREVGCWHVHCSSAVDLALDTLSAARSFGVDQLALLIQRHLGSMVEKASMEDVMKVLLVSAKHEIPELCSLCSQLVAKSGLPSDLLAKHLPLEIAARIEELRNKSSTLPPRLRRYDLGGPTLEEQRIRRMRRALDSSDVELIKLMVMSEGLNLDRALALHYAVQNCSREVVKALLELGVADVNFPASPAGKTPLHIAAEMVSPDMVAVLLDHHADPNMATVNGVTPLDILRTLTSDFLFKGAIPGLAHMEPNKLRLCLELVQSAVSVISREEGNGTNSSITSSTVMYPPPPLPPTSDDHRRRIPSGGNINTVNLNHDDLSAARTLYLNLGAAVESSSSNHHYQRSSENSSDEPPPPPGPPSPMYHSHHHHY